MAKLKKNYNFVDVINLARPNVFAIDVVSTAMALSAEQEPRFFSYSSAYSKIDHFVRHRITEEYLLKSFNFYSDEWKNRYLKDVVRLLDGYFKGRGSWYKERSVKTPVLGVSFWPAQHGVWFEGGKAYNVLVNARQSPRINSDERKFLARAMYELHGIDDPNNPDQLILDVSLETSKKRSLRAHYLTETTMISLREFEHIMKRFFEALSLAGISEKPVPGDAIRDLLRKRK